MRTILWDETEDPFSDLPWSYYRVLSGHMEFGPENSPVQEIANDLNVGAVLSGTVSPMGPQLWWMEVGQSVIWRRYMCTLTRSSATILHMSPIVVLFNLR